MGVVYVNGLALYGSPAIWRYDDLRTHAKSFLCSVGSVAFFLHKYIEFYAEVLQKQIMAIRKHTYMCISIIFVLYIRAA